MGSVWRVTVSDGGVTVGRYSADQLRRCLHLFGCKNRHASNAAGRLFHSLRYIQERRLVSQKVECGEEGEGSNSDDGLMSVMRVAREIVERTALPPTASSPPPPSVGDVSLSRQDFEKLVMASLQTEHSPDLYAEKAMADFRIATSICERRSSVAILLCGTSGTGKSTLASLLAGRLGITTVISTDSIRQMLSTTVRGGREEELLSSSTYNVDADVYCGLSPGEFGGEGEGEGGKEVRAVVGWKAQSALLMESIGKLVALGEQRRESLIVEGVHITMELVVELMKRYTTVIPFLVYISNESKHSERFSVRAKYMTLEPRHNRYIKYFGNIRAIQEDLCRSADVVRVPKIDNTNVDKSLTMIHFTMFSCLRTADAGSSLFDDETGTCLGVYANFMALSANGSFSSKNMLRLIRQKASYLSDTPSTSSCTTNRDLDSLNLQDWRWSPTFGESDQPYSEGEDEEVVESEGSVCEGDEEIFASTSIELGDDLRTTFYPLGARQV